MKKQKYFYNQKTLQYEKHRTSTGTLLLRSFGIIASILLTTAVLFLFSYKFMTTPKESQLQNELEQMKYHYSSLTNQFDDLAADLENIQEKDAQVHRVIFGMDPIDKSIWNGGTGGHYKYNINPEKSTGEVLSESLSRVEKLKRKMELQGESLNTIYDIALKKEERLASIPSIKPIRVDKLKRKLRHLSGYGIRIHPVHKVKKFHKGIDFTAPRGTEIQATGNGVVIRVENKKRGYGKNVTIDHGHGYETLYAHMYSISVKKGEKVVKGQTLGTVGSSGTSTAPHLHYEVRYNGKSVNPIDFCMDELTPKEYQELVEKAEKENQYFDKY
jgi:murein DD-endopeptidase MepM/ murein hydrolase activator NlpD